MTLKERFIAWTEKRDKKLVEEEAVSRLYRKNRRYHRYFEGYTEYTRMDIKGTLRIERVYTGSYYSAHLSTALYALTRIGYIILALIAAYCDISATITNYPYNFTWYCTVPEALGFPLTFGLIMAVVSTALAERKLKIRQYRTIHTTKVYLGYIGAGVHLVTMITMIINILITGSAATPGIWWGPVKMLAAAICFTIVAICEKKTEYDVLENPVKPEPGGIEITRE